MKIPAAIMMLAVSLTVAGCQSTKIKANKLPKGVKVSKSVEVPNTTQIAYYLPKSATEHRFYLDNWNVWVEPGKGLKNGVEAAVKAYFPNALAFDPKSDTQVGLLIDMEPKWSFDSGDAVMTMKYRVLDANQKVIREGEKEYDNAIGNISSNTAFYNASLRATQLILVDVLNKLQPTATKFAAELALADVNTNDLVNLEKPVSTGTGFYINENGQLLTAAHVLDNCLVTKMKLGDEMQQVSITAKSALLDLAVIDSHQQVEQHLPFRIDGKFHLGETVTNVGYPLQGLLAASPNLTRGNISSKTALKGAMGSSSSRRQFSLAQVAGLLFLRAVNY
ncbi:S1 family peptidase [Shewanella maritima]|uniref:S1 family peptidase n=1 Tax=Shewanella maritima TaxID=2520507 RepID=UPI001F5E43E8|nr:serine protease [Shewanella maritima]